MDIDIVSTTQEKQYDNQQSDELSEILDELSRLIQLDLEDQLIDYSDY